VVLADLDGPLGEQGAQGALELGVGGRGHAELAREGLGLERLIVTPAEGGEDAVAEVGHRFPVSLWGERASPEASAPGERCLGLTHRQDNRFL
jgi:hypothetical protein